MKTKGKKIVTQQSEPQQPVVALTAKSTVWDDLDKVTKDLSPGDCRFVQEHVHGIQVDMRKMFELKDSIAAHLAAIYAKVGKELFMQMAERVFPRFGMSRSSTYRLLDSAQLIREVIPDPQVRQTLLGRIDKALTTTDSSGKVILTKGFEAALKTVPAPAKLDSVEAIDAYTAALVDATRKLGKAKPKSKAQAKKERFDRLTDGFAKYLDDYGTDEANKLLTHLRELVLHVENTIQGAPESKPKPQPVASAKTA